MAQAQPGHQVSLKTTYPCSSPAGALESQNVPCPKFESQLLDVRGPDNLPSPGKDIIIHNLKRDVSILKGNAVQYDQDGGRLPQSPWYCRGLKPSSGHIFQKYNIRYPNAICVMFQGRESSIYITWVGPCMTAGHPGSRMLSYTSAVRC